jgi:hypothetical protein
VSRRSVRLLLGTWFAIVWAAVVFRDDRFPLTWAPMYSLYEPEDEIGIRKVDPDDLRRGFVVTHRDGTTSRIGRHELNVPKWNFYRLYYQRAFSSPPVKHRYGNASLDPLNRWVRGLEPGEPIFRADWEFRLFRTVNRTLGHEPDDPEFVVRIEARYERIVYGRDPVELRRRFEKHADLRWKEEWRSRWE